MSWKEREAVARDLRAIYTAANVEAAEQVLEAFASKWDPRFPSISKSWTRRWDNVIPFFGYPAEIRKVIYTTNAIESVHASIRKVTAKRGAFPTTDSVRKVLYLKEGPVPRDPESVATMETPYQGLDRRAQPFTIVFEGRVPN